MSLNTLIAELEEALKAATAGPWNVHHQSKSAVEGGPVLEHNGFRQLVSDGWTGRDDGTDEANARLIALMRNSLPTLIEALKRQGEALEKIANPQSFSRNLPSCCQYTFDDACELFADIARAAHKEKSDV